MARESIPDFSVSKCEAILVIIGSKFRQSTVRIGRSETVIILGVIKNGHFSKVWRCQACKNFKHHSSLAELIAAWNLIGSSHIRGTSTCLRR